MARRSSIAPARQAERSSRTPYELGLRTYKAAVYESLVRMIQELEIEPGARLVEADLAREFSVSKTPIREAFLLLQGDGLVSLAPYQGATVTWLSLAEFEELVFIQDALEQTALPLVTERLTAREANECRRLGRALVRTRAAGDSRRFFEANVMLHEALFAPAGRRLVTITRSLITRPTRRYERVFVHAFDDAWDAELALGIGRLEGVLAGDAAAAAEAVRKNRARIIALSRSRVDDHAIRRFLAPGEALIARSSGAASDVIVP
jgi:DNA-binding GntR family transcriptional regulator